MISAKMGFKVQKKALINTSRDIEQQEKSRLPISRRRHEIEDDSKMAERMNSFFESAFNRKNEATNLDY